MTEYARADDLMTLREEYADVRDTPLLLDAHEDEMAGGYELRLHTTSRTLAPGTLGLIADHGFGVEYIGEKNDTPGMHVWALVE